MLLSYLLIIDLIINQERFKLHKLIDEIPYGLKVNAMRRLLLEFPSRRLRMNLLQFTGTAKFSAKSPPPLILITK